MNGTNFINTYTRSTRLEGRINIYIAPDASDISRIRANAKYVWSINVNVVSSDGSYANNSASVDFSSAESGQTNVPGEPLVCRSKGVLEEELLNLI